MGKTMNYLKKNGLRKTFLTVWERFLSWPYKNYSYRNLSDAELAAMREKAEELAKRESAPSFSILVPCYNTKPEDYRALLASVQSQVYPNWELILTDASDENPEEHATIAAELNDSRIQYYALAENKGISGNTNEALFHASKDYVVLLDHDDLLTPDALFEMAAAIVSAKEEGRKVSFLYSDEDKIDSLGKKTCTPHYKPDYNYDLLLSNNYICHLLVADRFLVEGLKYRSEFDGSQDYDMILRLAESCHGEGILHVAKVLYHWRLSANSTAENPESKLYAFDAGKRAIEDHLARVGRPEEVHNGDHLGYYTLAYTPETALQKRKDVGAVCGLVFRGRKAIGGPMDREGNLLFPKAKRGYSGYMNCYVNARDVERIDIRNAYFRKEEAMDYILNHRVGRMEMQATKWENLVKLSCEDSALELVNASVSDYYRERGQLLLYLPMEQ